MSDLDSLVVTFQTQLSDVMEAVVKTAMYEVTRLVEDGFLEEVRRRSQEVEALRKQLRWAERQLSDQGGKEGGRNGRCVNCAKEDVDLSGDSAEERPSKDLQDDVLRGCSVKKEDDSEERWTRSCRQEVMSESTQTADDPADTHGPDRNSETTEEDDVSPAADVKEEEVNKPSCSAVHLGWSGVTDCEEGPESQSDAEMIETQPKLAQETGEELLRNAYIFPKEKEETHMATDPSLEVDSGWVGLTVTTAGLLQNHGLTTEKDCDAAKARSSLKQTERELSTSVTADVNVLVTMDGDQISCSKSSKTRLQNNDALGVTIKQEVIVDSDGFVESAPKEKSFSSSVKQQRVVSEALKQNHVVHKAALQEVAKLHSKVGTGLRLQAALQHLHRPRKLPHTLLNSSTAALSVAHSQVVNLNPLNRVPSTSKAALPPPLSVQRIHLGDKQPSAHNRAGVPWVSIKSQHQSANPHHTDALPHPDSHPHVVPRHLLRCGQCGKCFPHPSNLKAHLQTHTGERPFCCSLCGRSFTKLSNLKAHRRVHTGERPYSCLACGKRFTQKCNLKRHQRIHLDV